MIQKFDNLHSPAARYDFEGDLLDASGAALHLTASSPFFRRVYENIVGLSGGFLCNRNGVSDSALRLFGDLTVNLLCVLRATPSQNYIVAFQASGETEPTNYGWSIQLVSGNQLAYFSEHAAGADDVYTDAGTNQGLPAVGVPFLLTLRRKGNVIQFFVDGVPFGDPSSVLNAPTGATTSQLVVNQGASNAFDLFGLEVLATALTDAQIKDRYNHCLGGEFDALVERVQSAWVGNLTTSGASVMIKTTYASDALRLALTGPAGTTYTSPLGAAHGEAKRFDLGGLDADTAYTYEVQSNGVTIDGQAGGFRTAPSGAASFTVAFSGDALTGSNHASFHEIRALCPLLFLHLGDAHYRNIATNDPKAFHAAFDEMLAAPRQSELFANIPIAYLPDDHDYGANNSNGSSPSRPAATSVYRLRVPSYPLVEAGPNGSLYHSFTVGRVLFVMTDQRTAASANSATDTSSKSMLGTAQKTWFKNLLSNSSGKLVVWVCPRLFEAGQVTGSDSWSGFTTERAELVSHIHSVCPGRVLVLSADMHAAAIDDGSNHDFLPGGGEPLRVFQSSPLDIDVPAGSGTYSEGLFIGNGQFGTMDIEDTGGSTIDVTWKARNSAGNVLVTHSFSVAV